METEMLNLNEGAAQRRGGTQSSRGLADPTAPGLLAGIVIGSGSHPVCTRPAIATQPGRAAH